MRLDALIALVVIAALPLCACRMPDDTEGTLDRVDGGVMRVGVTENDPWVELDGQGSPAGGVEVELARRFARDLDAHIQWVDGSEEELVDAMHEGSLDLVVGGLTSKSPWKKDVAFTRPYVETRTVVGVPPGTSPPGDLDGVAVAAETGSEAEGLLDTKTDAEVRAIEDLGDARGDPAAAHDYVLDDLGLQAASELSAGSSCPTSFAPGSARRLGSSGSRSGTCLARSSSLP